MQLMKKDMGGAATMLGLAHAMMAAKLPVRLRVLVPAVENSVSGNAFRPLDIVRTRKGITVEIGNTDAEGPAHPVRRAGRGGCARSPALLIDFATLTGAARVALGPDLPALFANDDALAADLLRAGDGAGRSAVAAAAVAGLSRHAQEQDRRPQQYLGRRLRRRDHRGALSCRSSSRPRRPGRISTPIAWNRKTRPGRPEGGEALGLRAAYAMIEARFGQ